ncbi:MAG TPA: glycine--tRNA ligase [Candidatus Omnitrophota bacterium]|nr:glycine--tRNA ligase [Candidatus Omnitrophota bacterium]HRZ14893.1 glycine--tRNA ligase [Candidatus Omnitrophota bacterium]
MADLMEKIVSLCKRRGFIFPGSDIYGGLANSWDYGPYGVELKNNIKRAWWKANVYLRNDMLGMDAAILMHPKTWEASGHVENFFDLKADCKGCHKRFKVADLKDRKKCPECGGELTEARQFNLMFKTHSGPVEDASTVVYLRPETAQGMFVNFPNILDSRHPKLPFGLAQIGKSFRNEITPGNFTFRTREFEQMEIEYFCRPEESEKVYEEWVAARKQWYLDLGMHPEHIRFRAHEKDELAHYARACTDVEYAFPWGWSELEGIANRTDFDLKQHAQHSGKDLRYFDEVKKERFYPYIIEPSGGVDRCLLAFLVDAYTEEPVKEEVRALLKLHKDLAPIKAAVLPLLKNRPELVETAKKLAWDLKKSFVTVYDDTAAIGKLYRRQDEVGTLYCITVDVQSLEDKQVTVRDRDSMQQERISIDKVKDYLTDKLNETAG